MTGPNFVRFNSAGRLITAGGAVGISIEAPDAYANHGKRCVTVEPTGRASSREGAC
jgi:hypothetical protein